MTIATDSTIKNMMEVYRATANALDVEAQCLKEANESTDYYRRKCDELEGQRAAQAAETEKVKGQFNKEKLEHANTREQLLKVRRHRDDLAAKVKAARAKLTDEPQTAAADLLAILAEEKDQA